VEDLNYRHLRVFWVVAREGGVTRASRKLNVSQPTVTAQIRALEASLGQRLFARSGRGVVLTDAGRSVHRYAEEILGLGQELVDTMHGRSPERTLRLTVGVAMVVPKLIAYRIMEPALRLGTAVRLECLEDTPERLLGELASFALDLVLADTPVGPTTNVRAYSHLLGECPLSLFGTERLAREYRPGFPRSLNGAPFLLPRRNSAVRLSLDEWFEREGVRPRILGEFEDSSLMKAFGQTGLGLFPAPAPTEVEVRRQHRVRLVGRLESVRQRFYAITIERRLKHPAVVAISQAARSKLFD
jgi:LysR family transcriptional activator of nhaA